LAVLESVREPMPHQIVFNRVATRSPFLKAFKKMDMTSTVPTVKTKFLLKVSVPRNPSIQMSSAVKMASHPKKPGRILQQASETTTCMALTKQKYGTHCFVASGSFTIAQPLTMEMTVVTYMLHRRRTCISCSDALRSGEPLSTKK
jgi:hypothetical protein